MQTQTYGGLQYCKIKKLHIFTLKDVQQCHSHVYYKIILFFSDVQKLDELSWCEAKGQLSVHRPSGRIYHLPGQLATVLLLKQ